MSVALSEATYYGIESDRTYMSNSLYKKFMTCEAATMAYLNGDYAEPASDAMLVGSYVHAAVEGTLDEFKQTHPDMFTKSGELKAAFKQADKMIDVLLSDPLVVEHLEGSKEQIITAEMFGCMWKTKLDVLNIERQRIADVKTVRSLSHKEWSVEDNRYLLWIEAYGYVRQMAIYTEVVRRALHTKPFSPRIVAVTKEDIPDKAILSFSDDDLEAELSMVEWNMPRILAVKDGLEPPRRCERCNYCKSSKKLTDVLYFRELVM